MEYWSNGKQKNPLAERSNTPTSSSCTVYKSIQEEFHESED